MAFLKINGLRIRASDAEQENDGQVVEGRTINGRMFRDRRTNAYRWPIQTALYPLTDAQALLYLLEGHGHRWSFDTDTFSDNGAGITSGTYSLTGVSPTPKFGLQRLDITAVTTIAMGAAYSSWTVAYWVYIGGTWVHRIGTSNGDEWENQVKGTYGWGVSMSGGTLTLPAGDYDDLVILPFVISDEMATSWPTTRAYSAMPHLVAEGEFYDGDNGGTVEVMAVEPQINGVISAQVDGVYQRAATLSFDLCEIGGGS